MELTHCKKCNATLAEQAGQNGLEIILCDRCATVHYVGLEPVSWFKAPEQETQQEKEKRKIPAIKRKKKFKRRRLSDGVEIYYEWLTPEGRRWVRLSIVLLNLPTWCIAFPFATTFDEPLWSSWLSVWCAMYPFHAIVGLVCFALIANLDHVSIQIRSKTLKIKHSRLFTYLNKTIDRRSIEQVFARRRELNHNFETGERSFSYDVYYLKKSDRKAKKLVTGLETLREALFIEQQIERLYRIEDMPVDSEYRNHSG